MIVCVPFKSRVSVNYSPLALLAASLAGPQSLVFCSLLSHCWTWGAGCGLLTPLLGENSAVTSILLFMGSLPDRVSFDVSVPPTCLFVILSLYIFVVENLLHYSSGLFH